MLVISNACNADNDDALTLVHGVTAIGCHDGKPGLALETLRQSFALTVINLARIAASVSSKVGTCDDDILCSVAALGCTDPSVAMAAAAFRIQRCRRSPCQG